MPKLNFRLLDKRFISYLLIFVSFSILAWLWLWPVVLNLKNEFEIDNSSKAIELYDRELWDKSNKGMDQKWSKYLIVKLLYSQKNQDLNKSGILLLQRQSHSGDFYAASSLSDYYSNNDYGYYDLTQSKKWKKISQSLINEQADQGKDSAIWEQGQMYLKGDGVELNVKRSHEIFYFVAEKNPAEFGLRMGNYFLYGDSGFVQSDIEAFKWYERTASAGGQEAKVDAARGIDRLIFMAWDRGTFNPEVETWKAALNRINQDIAFKEKSLH